MDVCAFCRRFSLGNPEEPAEGHDMIQPDGAAEAHILTQELNQQLISAGTQRHWVDRRQPPVLPLWGKIVRRRSAIGVQRHHRLIHPCLLYTSDAADERSSVDL